MMTTEGRASEEERIKKVVMNMRDAWNRGDINSFDSIFSEDVEFVSRAGKLFTGRDQIEPEHIKERELAPKDTEMAIEQVGVRFLRDEIAVAHIETSVRPGKGRAMMTAVFMKKDGEWRITAAQNTIKV